MRATVAAGSPKGNARVLDIRAAFPFIPAVSGEPLARRASPSLPAIPPAVQRDLDRVEDRLRAELVSREARLEEIATHLVRAGGKRVRPLVVLLVFDAAAVPGHARRDDAVEAAVALELIHSATLLHDDIIDGGETRRGRPSALRRFGLADTLVAGDFLFCRAFAICARFEPDVVRWAAEACVSLTEGEVLQGRHRRDPAVTVATYDEIILRKTAALFAVGSRTAAHLAGAAPPVVEAMAACGRHAGLAFQMRDDLLDVAGHPAETGKPRGIDLRDGNPSLPIVLALERDAEVRRLFSAPALTEADIERGLARIGRSGVLPAVAARVGAQLEQALALMDALPASPARAALREVALSLADRQA
jgi:octaprenyl-diphosphate synthase